PGPRPARRRGTGQQRIPPLVSARGRDPTNRRRPMIEATALAEHLDDVLQDATIPELPNHYRGKVRDNYDLADGRRIIIATDRLSAFDRIITAIPFKGQAVTQ